MHSKNVEEIAKLIRSKILGGKILSIRLSDKYSPHLAEILLQNYKNQRVAAFVELQNTTVENMLTTAILRFHELRKLKTKFAEQIWIVSNQSPKLAKLRASLRDDWQKKIRVFDRKLVEKFAEAAEIEKIKFSKPKRIGKSVRRVISLAPEKIQIQGSLLTFNGLPFANFEGEKIWCGVENRQPFDEISFKQLLDELMLYRRADSPNKFHAFYKMLPESWLESILRRDISVLDPNLILSPLHHQFRTSAEEIDLLALRKDGRLVVIELKVSPNREHLLQAVDYWQEIERQRAAGNLAGIFGDLQIADELSLIYLVAPHSAFHKNFRLLADAISEEIEIYRFDINENWREQVKILDREKA